MCILICTSIGQCVGLEVPYFLEVLAMQNLLASDVMNGRSITPCAIITFQAPLEDTLGAFQFIETREESL